MKSSFENSTWKWNHTIHTNDVQEQIIIHLHTHTHTKSLKIQSASKRKYKCWFKKLIVKHETADMKKETYINNWMHYIDI